MSISLSSMNPNKSSYLRARDFADGLEMNLTCDRVASEKLRSKSGEEEKLVLYFKGKEKGLVLNQTNLDVLVRATEDKAERIAGLEVVLFRTVTQFDEVPAPALRLRLPDEPSDVDEIPF